MVYVIRQQNLYEKNPGLIPPRNNYDVKIELNDQEKAKLEEELKKYDDLIQNFVPATGQQEVDLWDGNKGMIEPISKPDAQRFYGKATALEKLGRYTEAIKTLNEVFEHYEESATARNSLWLLYSKVGEHKYAIMNFQKIIDTFGDPIFQYYERIIRTYLIIWDGEQAWQRYIKYEKAWGKRNEELMSLIKAAKLQTK